LSTYKPSDEMMDIIYEKETEDSEPTCDYCGGEVWDVDDLEFGKCKMCIVNACQHIQSEIVSYDLHITHYERHITTHEVCMDCEVCWTVRYQLDNGNKSKLTHEDVNTSDIYQD